MLNCNLRVINACDVSEPRTEAGKLETLAPCDNQEARWGENLQRMHRQGIKGEVAEESGILLD
jgi:hypothetical protein